MSSENVEWHLYNDATTGAPYYYNPSTGESQWVAADDPVLDQSVSDASLSTVGASSAAAASFEDAGEEYQRQLLEYQQQQEAYELYMAQQAGDATSALGGDAPQSSGFATAEEEAAYYAYYYGDSSGGVNAYDYGYEADGATLTQPPPPPQEDDASTNAVADSLDLDLDRATLDASQATDAAVAAGSPQQWRGASHGDAASPSPSAGDYFDTVISQSSNAETPPTQQQHRAAQSEAKSKRPEPAKPAIPPAQAKALEDLK